MTMNDGSTLPFGRRLKRLRLEQDLTQEALAERADCSVQSIRFFENGKRRPSRAMAEHLARILSVPEAEVASFVESARTPLAEYTADAERAPAHNARQSAPRMLAANHLIGRRVEIETLTRLIVDERHWLVTLTGMGGIGKTHLALHLAHRLQAHFPDGAAFVSLASLTQVNELPMAVARSLDVPLPGRGRLTEQLDELLAGRCLLLVLDNYEHLLAREGSVALTPISHLLQQHGDLQLLVTTRERLRLSGEQTVELGGLTLPGRTAQIDIDESDAVLLFAHRATQVAPHFALTAGNRDAVRTICNQLEGVPLAIELAAAWTNVLTPAEIAAEITVDIDFLARGDRDAPQRHRSLRELFDQSWSLLKDPEQRAFARLALFRGGFTRRAGEAVAGAPLSLLAQLVDKSLIRVFMQQTPEGPATTRYYIHNLLRIYLLEKLADQGEAQAARRKHARYYTELAEQMDATLYSGNAVGRLQPLNEELANLRAALEWALKEGNDPALGLRLAGALGRYWYLAGQWQEGCDWLALALQHAAGEPALVARALVAQGQLYHRLDAWSTALQVLERGLALWRDLGDERQIAWTLFQLGTLTGSRGDYQHAERYLSESLARYRTLADTWAIATVLNQLAGIASSRGDYETAEARLDEALPTFNQVEESGVGLAVTANLLGRIALERGNLTRAVTLFETALDITRRRNHREGQAWSLLNIGLAKLAAGDLIGAEEALNASVGINQELGRRDGIMAGQEALAAVAAAAGAHDRARNLLAQAEQLRTTHGLNLTAYEQALHERTLAALATTS